MVSRWWVAAAALAAAGLGMVSCASSPVNTNNCGSGAPPSLVGTYALSSYTFGSAVYTAPPASGALWLTSSTYADTLVIPVRLGDSTVADHGTYQILGASCTLWQSLAGQRDFTGSFTLKTAQGLTTLRLSGNDSLHVIIGIWTHR